MGRGNWNNLSLSDSYKMGHFRQLPKHARRIHSYFESRGTDPKFGFTNVVFFGLQYNLDLISGQFVTQEGIDKAERRCRLHFGNDRNFNRAGWEYILHKHGGRLPVRIRAVPEGTVVPTHNCLMVIENTDENIPHPEGRGSPWLTNWLETLLVQVWYPCTVATQSREMKKTILRYLQETGDPAGLEYKLHDFGCRGVSSMETAGIGGGAHLVNFRGTDTLPALEYLDEVYGDECGGTSIAASEHSTITSWLEDHEVDAMKNMLEQYPDGYVACVSDSFDIYRACRDYWGGELRQMVLDRNGTLVVRPDSGDPVGVLCGTKDQPGVFDILYEKFPGGVNSKGYKLLDPHVRVIQGDGIDYTTLGMILEALKQKRWSADNIAFGSGGGLLQKLNRDTLKFAFKCSSILVDDEERDVFKRPITDGGKKSKSGRFKLVYRDGTFVTVKENEPGDDLLRLVFENGVVVNRQNLAEIRDRAKVAA